MKMRRAIHWLPGLGLAVIAGLIAWTIWAPSPLLGPLPAARVLLPYQEDGLWGLLDETGTVVMLPTYDEILFIGEIAEVRNGPLLIDHRVDTTRQLLSNTRSTPATVVVGYRKVERRRASPNWPFVRTAVMAEFELYDADLTLRTRWLEELYDDPFVEVFSRHSPLLRHGDHTVVVTDEAITQLTVPTDSLQPRTKVYRDGITVVPHPTTTVVHGADGTPLFDVQAHLPNGHRRGRYMVLESDLNGNRRDSFLVDMDDGEIRRREYDFGRIGLLTDEIAGIMTFDEEVDQTSLLHIPSGREVILPKANQSSSFSMSGESVGVVIDRIANIYDGELGKIGDGDTPTARDVDHIESVDGGFLLAGSRGEETYWMGFYDTAGRATESWSDSDSPLRLENTPSGSRIISYDRDRARMFTAVYRWMPWATSGRGLAERPDPDDPDRVIFVEPDGQQLGGSFDAMERVVTAIPAAKTICQEPILIVTPRELRTSSPMATIQIGADHYPHPTIVDRPMSTWAKNSRTVVAISRDSIVFEDDFDSPIDIWVFDLAARRWWPEAVEEIECISDTVIAVKMRDGTCGYRRPDGTWIKRWQEPPTE